MDLPPQFSQLRGDVDEIRKAAQRGAAICRGLHSVRVDSIAEPGAFDLNGFIESYRSGRDDAADWKLRLGEKVPPFEMDPQEMRAILDRLSGTGSETNARRQITVETGARMVLGDQSNGPKMKPGEYACLELTDSARDVPPDEIEKVFHPDHPLGFSIVYSIVKHFHGYVWLYSEPGYGSAYKLYFPSLRNEDEKIRKINRGIADKRAILVIENDESVRGVVVRILGELGHETLIADSTRTAVEVFKEYAHRIQAILIDAILPDGNAKELASRLHALGRGIPIVYMSGYGESVLLQRGMIAPGDPFLPKPFGVSDIAGILGKIGKEDPDG